ncbi:chromate transporter [Hymenobacter koreensis]|uniref:Chromate transporter n=1 Tax=Hymenobacter koreensis TaxID=1084523 RepID=A0ABP8IUH4_9BACT
MRSDIPPSPADYTGPYDALLEKELAPLFLEKLPPAPLGLKDGFVRYFPWITVVLMVLLLPVLLLALGLGAVLAPLGFVGGLSGGLVGMVTLGLSAVILVLDLLSLPGLFGRKRRGWVWAYYAQLLGLAAGLLSFSLFSLLLGGAFLWLLFQVRGYYK